MDNELRKSWINWREELGFTNKITGNGQKLRKSWTNGRKEAGSNNIAGNGKKKLRKSWINWREKAQGEKLYVTSKLPDGASVGLTHPHSSLQTDIIIIISRLYARICVCCSNTIRAFFFSFSKTLKTMKHLEKQLEKLCKPWKYLKFQNFKNHAITLKNHEKTLELHESHEKTWKNVHPLGWFMINWNKFGLQPQKKYGFVSHICNSEPAPSITIPNSNLLKEIIVFWYFFIDAWLFYLSLNILPNLNFSLWMTCLVKIATPLAPSCISCLNIDPISPCFLIKRPLL